MIKVTELGYLGIGVKDAAAWKEFASQVVGMEVLDEGEKDRFYLRMDNWHHRIVVHTSGEDDLLYLGWRVGGPDELGAMEEQLRADGVAVRRASEEEARERRVLGLLKLTSPGGNPTEIFYGPQIQTAFPFYPGRRMHGRFLTGSEGIGHVEVAPRSASEVEDRERRRALHVAEQGLDVLGHVVVAGAGLERHGRALVVAKRARGRRSGIFDAHVSCDL